VMLMSAFDGGSAAARRFPRLGVVTRIADKRITVSPRKSAADILLTCIRVEHFLRHVAMMQVLDGLDRRCCAQVCRLSYPVPARAWSK
jgi:hypothetical protein